MSDSPVCLDTTVCGAVRRTRDVERARTLQPGHFRPPGAGGRTMPLVLATGAATESGHTYADVLGLVYEYPRRYRNLIQPGEVFVYYRGRRRDVGGTQPQVYLGCGTIGATSAGSKPDRMRCEILSYTPFLDPVPFKKADGSHLEPGGSRRGYFQPGVRRVDPETWEGIVWAATSPTGRLPDNAHAAYVPTVLGREIEKISRREVLELLRRRDDVLDVSEMPYNHPGYDIRATTATGPLYVEVKGTQGLAPGFFLTEGERRFAAAHPADYLLAVVTGIDPATGASVDIHLLDEPPDSTNAALRPYQWRGELPGRAG